MFYDFAGDLDELDAEWIASGLARLEQLLAAWASFHQYLAAHPGT